MPTGTIHIGTSGWVYSHWRGVFYPPAIALLKKYRVGWVIAD